MINDAETNGTWKGTYMETGCMYGFIGISPNNCKCRLRSVWGKLYHGQQTLEIMRRLHYLVSKLSLFRDAVGIGMYGKFLSCSQNHGPFLLGTLQG